MEEGREQAVYYRDVVKTAMDALRTPVDELEMIVDSSLAQLIRPFSSCTTRL